MPQPLDIGRHNLNGTDMRPIMTIYLTWGYIITQKRLGNHTGYSLDSQEETLNLQSLIA